MPQAEIRLDHVSFGLRSLADAAPVLVEALGGGEVDGGPGPEYEGCQWRYARGERLEAIAPERGAEATFLARFLEARGPGVHHVTFTVPSLVEACDRARSFGYDVVGYRDDVPSWKEAFLHPKQAQGVVVQLAEWTPGAGGGSWREGWEGFPRATPRTPPAEIVALVLRSTTEAAALRQWEGVLGGRLERQGDVLRFSWSSSPIALAIEIEPGASEGPERLEVRCARDLGFGSGEGRLGTPIVQIP